jgi:hypothetical protein
MTLYLCLAMVVNRVVQERGSSSLPLAEVLSDSKKV